MVPAVSPGELLGLVDAFLFDCDGVLWRGPEVLPGVVETLDGLRKKGKKVLFVTNNASKSRVQNMEKLRSLGIFAQKEEVYCSSYALASYLKRSDFKKKAFVIGMHGVEDELAEQGIGYEGGTAFPCEEVPLEKIANTPLDDDVGAVVVGLDQRVCYAKIARAVAYLMRREHLIQWEGRQGEEVEECLFVAANADSGFNASNGQMLPGAGAVLAAVEVASERKAVVVGKPHAYLLDLIRAEHSLVPSRTLMVGDRLDTDILFGATGGLRTLLVLTGVTNTTALQQHIKQGGIAPDLILPSVADIPTR